MAFKVEIKGLAEIKAKLGRLPKHIEAEAGAIIEDGARLWVRNAQRDAPKDIGASGLSGGISYRKISLTNYEVVSAAAYSAYMEFGTKSRFRAIPGVDASQFRSTGGTGTGEGFFDNILDWVKRKKITGTYSVKTGRRTGNKIDQQIEDEQVAFAIYLSIMRHGVNPHPFFFKQKEVVVSQIETRLKALNDSIKL